MFFFSFIWIYNLNKILTRYNKYAEDLKKIRKQKFQSFLKIKTVRPILKLISHFQLQTKIN